MANRYGALDQSSAGATQATFRGMTDDVFCESFVANTSNKITFIQLNLAGIAGSPTGLARLELWSGGTNPNSGSLIATSNNLIVENQVAGAINFIFPTQPSQVLGTQYYWKLFSDSKIDSKNRWAIGYSPTDVYANGTRWVSTDGGTNWTQYATTEFYFKTFTNADGGTWEIDTDCAGTWVDPDGIRGTVYPCTKASLETLKGGAMHSSDTLCVYNAKGAIAQDGETWPIKIISMGEKAGAVAAPSGQKNGYFIMQGGSTVNFLGDATNTNSGIKSSPASAASESKNIELIYDRSNGKDIYENNSTGTLDTAKRYTHNIVYGRVRTIDGWNATAGRWAKTFVNNSYGSPFPVVYGSTSYSNYGPKITNMITSPLGTYQHLIPLANSNIDLPIKILRNIVDYTGLSGAGAKGVFATGGANSKLISGGSINYKDNIIIDNSTTIQYNQIYSGGTYYYGNGIISYSSADINTEIRPDGFALVANGKDGQLVASWTNGSAYTGNDEIFVFSSAGALLGMFTATVGSGVITGLTTGTEYAGVYACATSDGGNTLTAKSVTASGTPFDNELISITPNIGSIDGNTTVTIEATGGMTGATGAIVNGVALTDFAVINDTTVTGKTGAMTAGQGDVIITTPLGTATLVGGFTAQTGVIKPGEIVLTTKNIEYNKILVSWEGGFGSLINTLYKNGVEIFTTNTKNSFIDTVELDTEYEYEIIAENDAGQSSDSSIIRSWSVYDIPEETPASDMAIAIRDSILQIKNNGNGVFSDENVVIGRILNHDSDRTYPCCEIYLDTRGSASNSYESQRTMDGSIYFQIIIFEKKYSNNRDSGSDLQSISKIGSAVLRQMYSFIDRKTDVYPCKGFIMTNPDYQEMCDYEIFAENINTSSIRLSFRVDTKDTEL